MATLLRAAIRTPPRNGLLDARRQIGRERTAGSPTDDCRDDGELCHSRQADRHQRPS
jgi:hypothetical protein